MCGFIGFITDINNKQLEEISEKFNIYFNKQKERGPDYSIVKKIKFKSKLIQVGFSRLAIQDLNESSNRIFYNDENLILFNGEIYNHISLKEKYLGDEIISTKTDTEILHKLFQKKGTDIINELEGIFSIVFIDLKTEKVFMARDYTGTKPLYFSNKNNDLFFSSEAWFLYSLSNKELDYQSVNFFLNFGFTDEEKTLIKNVNKVKPRYIYNFNLSNNELEKNKYFDLSKSKFNSIQNFKINRELLENTIKKNLITDTKIGTFLSGGVDSTTISLIAKKYNENIEAITTCFLPENKFKKFNIDFQFSKQISKDYNLKLHTHYISNEKELYDDFLKITDYLDEPVSNLNFLNTYWQTKIAKENNIKVVLTGDGADELFCGYDRYKSVFLADKLSFFSFLSKKVKKINNLENREIPLFYYSIFKNKEHKKIFKNIEHLEDNLADEIYENMVSDKKIDYINFFDTKYWLTNESNYKLDKCSMINSVEARVPFQDINLIKNFFFIPNNLKFSIQNRKFLLKEMNFLPKYVINRPKTGWFSPEKIFLETNLNNIISEFFDETKIKSQNIIDYNEIISFFKRFPKENWKIKRQTLTIILFQIWYDKVLRLD